MVSPFKLETDWKKKKKMEREKVLHLKMNF